MLDTFAVIAEPRRRQILDVLQSRDATVTELTELLAMSQPAVSKHLRVLRESGLVKVTPVKQQRVYSLDPAPLEEIADWIVPYQQHWGGALDRLASHLDSKRSNKPRRKS